VIKRNTHRDRIVEMINSNCANQEIAHVIYKEFGIYKTLIEIEQIRSNYSFKKNELNRNSTSTSSRTAKIKIEDLIIEFLKDDFHCPKSARSIIKYLNKRLNLSINRIEFKSLLNSLNLKSQIRYCNKSFTYSYFDDVNAEDFHLNKSIEINRLTKSNLNDNVLNQNKNNVSLQINEEKWRVLSDMNLVKTVKIDYDRKILFTSLENLTIDIFLNELFKQRDNHRNPEVDLFFENLEFFFNH
jgi:hypothetical protein